MKITIIYDNTTTREDLVADWGFACLVEAHGRRILFDTGAKGFILLDNMQRLGIEVSIIEEVFISHDHWDHTGGLADLLAIHPVPVHLPSTMSEAIGAKESHRVCGPTEIHEGIFSTGTLEGIEQSLAVRTEKGIVVIVGCSHPGVERILEAAAGFGRPYALIGGLHGFDRFEAVKDLEIICPTHCTQHAKEIAGLYPEKFLAGGAGRVLEV